MRVSSPTAEIGCSLGHAVGQVNIRIDITLAVTASDLVFDSRVGFTGSIYPLNTVDMESLRNVAIATDFGATLAVNGL